MVTVKQFFSNLNDRISIAKTQMALKVLAKQGRKFVNNLPPTTDPKIKKMARLNFSKSMKKIKIQSKKLLRQK